LNPTSRNSSERISPGGQQAGAGIQLLYTARIKR
jgi:hypothetical protein